MNKIYAINLTVKVTRIAKNVENGGKKGYLVDEKEPVYVMQVENSFYILLGKQGRKLP